MTALGFARRVRLHGADRPFRRAARRIGADPRRRHGRPGRRVRTAPRRLQGQGARIQRSAPVAATWTLRGGDEYTELGGATQQLRIRSGPLRQSGSVAHSVSPPRDARLRQRLEACRSSRSSRSISTPTCIRRKRIRRQAAALSARLRRTSTATSPSCSRKAVNRARPRCRADDRGQGEAARRAAQRSACSTRTIATSKSTATSDRRGYDARSRRRPDRPAATSTPHRARGRAAVRPLANDLVTTDRLRSAAIDCSSRSAAWIASRGVRIASVAPLVQLDAQGDHDRPGRARRHRHVRRRTPAAATTTHATRRLVPVHDSAVDPEPDSDERRRADGRRDPGRAVRGVGQDRPAVQAPLLGRGRAHLRRHQLSPICRSSRSAIRSHG